MTTTPDLKKVGELRPRLTVIGVGGAGCNAVNNMINAGLTGVNFVVANTDSQSLVASSADFRIQLGASLTEGLGAGSKPEIGEAAAEEAVNDIREMVAGSHMVFVAAGMGGGTGTGAAAVIARVARELGILTVGVVTKPFQFEGARRMRTAEEGIVRLRDNVDTLIVIPNQNLFRIATDKTTFAEAFILADQVLYSGVACVVDLIVKEGLINLDFADVRTVMSGMGTAMMGTGEAAGPGRTTVAAEEAISNPLLDDVTLKGARGLLLSITGGRTLTLYEVDEAATRVRAEVDPEANVIVGATFDETLEDRIRVSIVASGMARATIDPRRPFEISAGAPPKPSAATSASSVPMAVPPPLPQTYEAMPGNVQRRLSEALSADYNIGQPISVGSPPPPMPAGAWMAPGNVRIEEELEQTYVESDPSLRKPHVYHDARPATAEPAFAPMPPAEFNRTRRMPEIEEFPVVGQRDYMAKKSSEWGRPAPPPAAEAKAPPAKSGWFSRFSGKSRSKTDSRVRDEAPVPADSHAQKLPDGNARGGAQGAAFGTQNASAKNQEMPDLPVFFGSRRK